MFLAEVAVSACVGSRTLQGVEVGDCESWPVGRSGHDAGQECLPGRQFSSMRWAAGVMVVVNKEVM